MYSTCISAKRRILLIFYSNAVKHVINPFMININDLVFVVSLKFDSKIISGVERES